MIRLGMLGRAWSRGRGGPGVDIGTAPCPMSFHVHVSHGQNLLYGALWRLLKILYTPPVGSPSGPPKIARGKSLKDLARLGKRG